MKIKRSRKPWAETRQAKSRFLIQMEMSKLNYRVINWGMRINRNLHCRMGMKIFNLEARRLGNSSNKREKIKNLKLRVKSVGISSNKSIPLLLIMETFRLRVRRMTKKSIH